MIRIAKLKVPVEVQGIQPEILFAIMVANSIFAANYGHDVVITSVTDGDHGKGTLHKHGYAVDFRTRDMAPNTQKIITESLKKCLGDQYDVVLESNHIHIEFDHR